MMAKKAKTANVILRPHFKTHQSRVVGDWNREHGVDHITVSSMDMAEYFKGIYSHITLAIPFNIRELPRLNRLLKTQSMAILVDSV